MTDDFDDLSDMPKDTITLEEWKRRRAREKGSELVHVVQPLPERQ